jgi:hypothetical protein
VIRVKIEQGIIDFIESFYGKEKEKFFNLGKIFGKSKKQGISIRFSLTTCVPTNLCANLCYAHDGLDATPNSVVRGALNTCLITPHYGFPVLFLGDIE